MDVTALLKEFCSAVERRDGKAFASLFTEDGVYHDVFYGAFKGRQKLAEMIDDWFHRSARDFRWDMHRPVSNGEMLYAYSSAVGNNGSAFAGLSANTPWYNTTLGIAMLAGRFGYVVPVMAIAGSLAAKIKVPQSAGTFPTDGSLFVALLVGVILIVGGLQYFPALALGPIVEHFLMLAGKTF